MVSNKRLIVVYIEQARIPNETTSITRSEVPITGDIVIHHRVQNGANKPKLIVLDNRNHKKDSDTE